MPEDVIEVAQPRRWDVPYWREPIEGDAPREMSGTAVGRLLAVEPFRSMDPSRFLAPLTLRGILENDTRIRSYRPGQIITRQGDYGGSAFFILSGRVRVLLDKVDDEIIGRRKPEKRGFFDALQSLWFNPRMPEVRGADALRGAKAGRKSSGDTGTAVFVQDVSAVLGGTRSAFLGAGEVFGEIASLTRAPRTATIIAEEASELVEVRWQGLREIRQRAPEFKAHIDRLYRERSLAVHLRETSIFSHLSDAELESVAAATELQTFGTFDWQRDYRKALELGAMDRLRMEPLIAEQGSYPNGVYLIRSGFARISELYNHGERTISYLGRGQIFGFDEIAANWRTKAQTPYRTSLRAVGYVDVLFVPSEVVEKFVLPAMKEAPAAQQASPAPPQALRDDAKRLSPEMLEYLVEGRFINGTATMMIDMDRCTRCDDCVRACAATHNNNPRFLRHGPMVDRFMIANACMHCLDPVCMIGCPTGAIHRTAFGGQVVINDNTCIGCATCANSCPYDNIQMTFARDGDGSLFLDRATNQPIQKAAKCDLCVDQMPGVSPACQRACPHDAMIRVDMRDQQRLAAWLKR
jgi:Fe-S-cluster-containing dehydrogenase component/CRP-like cAMP-binding protein